MRLFKLVLSEKRDIFNFNKAHEKFIQALNREDAYNKALKIAATFFKNYNIPTGIPDGDMIFHFNNDYASIWINSLDEIEVI